MATSLNIKYYSTMVKLLIRPIFYIKTEITLKKKYIFTSCSLVIEVNIRELLYSQMLWRLEPVTCLGWTGESRELVTIFEKWDHSPGLLKLLQGFSFTLILWVHEVSRSFLCCGGKITFIWSTTMWHPRSLK